MNFFLTLLEISVKLMITWINKVFHPGTGIFATVDDMADPQSRSAIDFRFMVRIVQIIQSFQSGSLPKTRIMRTMAVNRH